MRLYWPQALRPAFDALLGIDDVLAQVVATSSQPALGAIRLAWWRDALERLDQAPPPAEPHLHAAAAQLLTRGVSGAALARIAEGWAALFDEVRDAHAIGGRGEALFAAGALLLGGDDVGLGPAGRCFALVDAARRHLAPLMAVDFTAMRVPRRLRPLTALARLALRDMARGEPLEPEATPGRAAALLRHRWSGALTRG